MMSLTNTADGSSLCNTLFYRRKLTIRRRIIKAKEKEGVSKLIHPLFVLPLPCLRHNSLFTAAMLLISYKMIYWALNRLYKLV